MNNRLYREDEWNYYLITVPIILFVTVFFIWTVYSEVDEIVKGDGTVIPSGQTKIIQHLEGGIIAKILAKEGDKVKEGDPLYIINNIKSKADFQQIELDIFALEAKKVRLEATLNMQKNVNYDPQITQKIPDIINNEQKIFYSAKKHFEEKIGILKKKQNQKEYKLNEQNNKLNNLSIEMKLAMESMKMLDQLYKKGAASKREYLTELAKKQELVTQLTAVKDTIPRLKEEIKEAGEEIDSLKSEYKSKALNELSKIQVELQKNTEKIKANVDRAKRENIISPANGIVKKLYFYTEGGIVKAGDKVAEVTPIDDALTIEAKIKTEDRAHIWTGQEVSIEITAYDFSKYGLLKGELVDISPDSFYDRQGNSFYIVKIKTDNFQFAPDLPILPGMVANISILTGSKTILEYILKPLKDIGQESLTEK